MSTAADEPDDLAEELPPAEPPPDPDSVRWLFHEAAVRNYLFAGLAALAMVFVIVFAGSGPIGAMPIVLLGVAGLLFRWPATPLFVLLLLLWFMIFPGGIPSGYDNPYEISEGHFRVTDVILVFSVVVYVVCHYRLYGFSAQAIPFENAIRRKGEKPFRRPPGLTRAGEIGRVLAVAGVVVMAGQLAWLFATILEADPGAFIPLKVAEQRPYYRRSGDAGPLAPGFSRFIVLTGLIFFTTLVARLVFGYWRLRKLGAAEAGMILLDAGWEETRRENVRVESWRAWRKKREAERAKKAAKGQSGGTARKGGER
jgi:hypothetical protein